METIGIWEDFSGILKKYIHSKVKDDDLTKDILQEVFIRIHLNVSKIKNNESLKSWLFTITHNVIMDHFKRQSKQIPFLETPENDENQTHSAKNCIRPLINKLPEKYREALLMSEINGKKQFEVAEALNISVSGAKSRIQRGRKLLQQGFIDCCDYKINDKGFLIGEHKEKENCKVCK